ncbi:MAG: HutD family protein [Clostridia bacterium]|nr:HutD family protein [Clostridia bacterium]
MYILKKENQTTSNWSGGTTTQLMIWPEHSEYKTLDFDWRISTATVEVKHSVFTELPNINRVIMSLNGPLTLLHKGEKIDLEPCESFSFDGGLRTESFNEVVDFNVMTSQQYKGNINIISGQVQDHISLKKHQGLYILKGSLKVDSRVFTEKDFIFEMDQLKELRISKNFVGVFISIEEI